jgi:hypothetical protein
MTARPDPAARLALEQACYLCGTHHDALQEALADLRRQPLDLVRLGRLDKADRRLLDQFAYRCTRLQDDMGARLMPALLRALGEDPAAMPVLDRLNRLEQIGWLGSAEGWSELRRIRNEFTHDYLAGVVERLARLELAMLAAERLVQIYRSILQRLQARSDLLPRSSV